METGLVGGLVGDERLGVLGQEAVVLLFCGRDRELVDPSDDFGPARIGEVDGAGDFVDRQPASGEEPFEIPDADAGEDVPQLRPLASLEFGRAEGAREPGAALGRSGIPAK